MKHTRLLRVLSTLIILGLVLSACATAEPEVVEVEKEVTKVVTEKIVETVVVEGTPQTVEKEVTKVVEVVQVVTPTSVPPTPEPTLEPGQVAREDTCIFDIDGGPRPNATVFNHLSPAGWVRQAGHRNAMLEPLFIVNYETSEIMGWMAESYEYNDDFTEVTIALRPGVEWSDGEPADADDLVFTIELLLSVQPGELYYASSMQNWVESVEKLDDLTVKFNLTASNPRFILSEVAALTCTGLAVVPEHIYKDVENVAEFKFYDPEKGWPINTGPYRLVSASENQFIYERRDDWWGAKTGFAKLPEPKRLVWMAAGEEELRAAKMANNELDVLTDITPGTYLAIKAKNPNVMAWYEEPPYAYVPDPCAREVSLNNMVPPWDDKEMRWALNHLIDREAIVRVAYEGSSLPSISPFPSTPNLMRLIDSVPDLYETYPVGEFNPEKAYAIFEKKGYQRNDDGYWEKDGELLSVDFQVSDGWIESKKNAMMIVEQLQRGGVDAVLRVLSGTWYDNLKKGMYEASTTWYSCGSVIDPWKSLDTYHCRWVAPIGESAEAGFWRWCNEEFSAIVDEMGTLALDDPRIDTLFAQAMEIWLDELPIIPITQARKLVPYNTTYWTNWPSAENAYIQPMSHCAWNRLVLHNITKAER